MKLKPLKLKPAVKDYIWGGTKIRDVLRKDTGSLDRIAESWEFSDDGDRGQENDGKPSDSRWDKLREILDNN